MSVVGVPVCCFSGDPLMPGKAGLTWAGWAYLYMSLSTPVIIIIPAITLGYEVLPKRNKKFAVNFFFGKVPTLIKIYNT